MCEDLELNEKFAKTAKTAKIAKIQILEEERANEAKVRNLLEEEKIEADFDLFVPRIFLGGKKHLLMRRFYMLCLEQSLLEMELDQQLSFLAIIND